MGFKYSTITDNYGTGTNIRSTSPKTYRGDSIQVTAQVGASAYTFTEGSEIYNSVHSQLQNVSPGTNVLLGSELMIAQRFQVLINFMLVLQLNIQALISMLFPSLVLMNINAI